MEQHPNVTLVRNALEAFGKGEMSDFGEVLAEDVEWHQIGGTTVRGLAEMMAQWPAGDDVKFDLELHDVVGNDDHVVALVIAHLTAGDLEITYRTAEVYHVVDGKVTERWAMSDDTEAINTFFGQLSEQTA
ncbi:MAG: nuclear transport factor 2 family protein [Actinobacteria bacterium]|nr:nuclear transport factor 2 family protein [Actinomycetota bacterium]